MPPRIILPDTLRTLLSDYDAARGDLRREGAPDADAGVVSRLARELVADVDRWRALVDRLDAAAVARLDPRRALAIVAESVFDEVLSPAGWRLLSADLALSEA